MLPLLGDKNIYTVYDCKNMIINVGLLIVIVSWMSQFDAQPGLTQQSFDTIARHTGSESGWGYRLCCLHVDEMEIKKHIDYDRRSGKTYGFMNIGNGPLDDPSQPQATKALVVIAVGLL